MAPRRGSWVGRVTALLVPLGLLPGVLAGVWQFAASLREVQSLSHGHWRFLQGMAGYLAVHLLLYKPRMLYVLEHELLHAVAAWLTGAEVRAIKVGKRGGHVTTSTSNIVIRLAPYCFPLFSILVGIAMWAVSTAHAAGTAMAPLLFVLGATLTFHLVFTAEFLRADQPDLQSGGYLLSLVIILPVNLLVVHLLLSVTFPTLSFSGFLRAWGMAAVGVYKSLYLQLFR